MKSTFKYIALLAAICALYSCGPMGDDVELALTSEDPESLLYTYERQTVRLKMDCNRSWKASCSEEWIELDTKKGSEGEAQSFIFLLSINPSYAYRTGEIVIQAGDRTLVLTITQEPEIVCYINENFYSESLIIERDLPKGWYSGDLDGDGFGWRCWRDPETEETFAYSCSYREDLMISLNPDNWMVSPKFNIPAEGFSVKWDTRGSNADYLGDKYEVCVGYYEDDAPLVILSTLCAGETTSATETTHYIFSLDEFVGRTICIGFHHFDSYSHSRVLVTNVEVSNRR